MSVKRSLEETKAGLRFKPPKSKRGRRTISLPPSAVALLREHRRRQLELRLALGLGKPGPDALVFCRPDGSPLSPDNLSRDWIRACKSLGLRRVMFHALRHTHVSALIAAGLDVVAISRRIGHGSPNVTLGTYGHLFRNTDVAAANAIEATLRFGHEG
jgi:integrase